MIKVLKYKNILLLCVLCTLTFPIKIYALANDFKNSILNNNNLIITSKEYQNLLNLGFTEFEIFNMDYDELEKNKQLKGKIIARNSSCFKNENTIELLNSLYGLQPGNISTGDKSLTTTIILVNGKYRYKTTIEWKNIPTNRSYDIIGIGTDTNIKISSNLYFKQTYCTSKSNCNSSTTHTGKKTTTGATATYLLPSTKSLVSMSAYLYFDVTKNTTSTITKLNAYGDYAHSTKSVSKDNAIDHNINRSGIVHSNSTSSYFDTFDVSKAVWTGSW